MHALKELWLGTVQQECTLINKQTVAFGMLWHASIGHSSFMGGLVACVTQCRSAHIISHPGSDSQPGLSFTHCVVLKWLRPTCPWIRLRQAALRPWGAGGNCHITKAGVTGVRRAKWSRRWKERIYWTTLNSLTSWAKTFYIVALLGGCSMLTGPGACGWLSGWVSHA